MKNREELSVSWKSTATSSKKDEIRGQKVLTYRGLAENTDGNAILVMVAGRLYAQWLYYFNAESKNVAKYLFASLFEMTDVNGESSGVYRNITEIFIGDKVILPVSNLPGYSVGANLDITPEAYRRLRRFGRGKRDPFPEFKDMAG